jgi:hypothetical protein
MYKERSPPRSLRKRKVSGQTLPRAFKLDNDRQPCTIFGSERLLLYILILKGSQALLPGVVILQKE